MKKLQQPFDVLKKHLKTHHNLSAIYEINFYKQNKDIYVFGHFFLDENKSIYGQIDVHIREIRYEIGDYKSTQGLGFRVYRTIKPKLEIITY